MRTDLEKGVVLKGFNGLWRHVVYGPTAQVSVDTRVLVLNSVCYPEINQFEASAGTYEILRFQVVVDYVVVMNYLERCEKVKLGVIPHIASIHNVNDKILNIMCMKYCPVGLTYK